MRISATRATQFGAEPREWARIRAARSAFRVSITPPSSRTLRRCRSRVDLSRLLSPAARLPIARLILAMMCVPVWAPLSWCQDNGTDQKVFQGNGAEIVVTVHDISGNPITAAVAVKLYRNGTILTGQGATTRGSFVFVVTTLGDFTVAVEPAGYPSVRKDFSVMAPERTQVDVYLRADPGLVGVASVPGRPLLAPKAKDAFDKGLKALSADKIGSAEKYVSEAARLAPGHPDVLYVQGVLYLKQKNWTEAQTALEKATQIDPSHARAFAALGMALSDQGKYEAAIAPLEKALKLDGSVGWETHWPLAKAYYRHEQYEDALRASQLALAESKGRAPEIALLVAQSQTAVGQYDEAAETLRQFVKEHGERPEAATAKRWLERLAASGRIGNGKQ
jgi:TolA-binding protein